MNRPWTGRVVSEFFICVHVFYGVESVLFTYIT
jgi:hypothetical protein